MFICIHATFDFMKEIFFVNNVQVITFSLCKLKKLFLFTVYKLLHFLYANLKITIRYLFILHQI